MNILLSMFLLLQLIDAISTWYALTKVDGMTEGNPLIKWLMNKITIVGALAAIKIPLIIAVLIFPFPVTILSIMIIFYCFIVINNIVRILKKKS